MSRGYIVPSLVRAVRFEPFTIAIMEGRPSLRTDRHRWSARLRFRTACTLGGSQNEVRSLTQ
jgi:hypothetical protein